MPERKSFLCTPGSIEIDNSESKTASKYTASLERLESGREPQWDRQCAIRVWQRALVSTFRAWTSGLVRLKRKRKQF